jgi:steroid delta-isomerase-like uncharacterized protein
MKKLNLRKATVPLVLAAGVLAATATSAAAQGCTEQLARDFVSGWSHNLPALMPLFTDDVVYEDTTVHAVAHGKEELRGFAASWFKAFPDLTFTLTSTMISADRAAIVWRGKGTQRGDMPGMPASNKVADVVGVSLIECTDGKVKHNVDYWDMATMMRQLGFLPSDEK